MNNFSVGSIVSNIKIPTLIGRITKLCENNNAVIEITDRNLNTKYMYICLDYWKTSGVI